MIDKVALLESGFVSGEIVFDQNDPLVEREDIRIENYGRKISGKVSLEAALYFYAKDGVNFQHTETTMDMVIHDEGHTVPVPLMAGDKNSITRLIGALSDLNEFVIVN